LYLKKYFILDFNCTFLKEKSVTHCKYKITNLKFRNKINLMEEKGTVSVKKKFPKIFLNNTSSSWPFETSDITLAVRHNERKTKEFNLTKHKRNLNPFVLR